MNPLVILSQREQEYLLRAIEAAPRVHDTRQLFLWTQGQVQALLPHQILVAMHFDPAGRLQRLECLHGSVLRDATMDALCGPEEGLAVRLARHCGARELFPCTEAAPFSAELAALGLGNVLLHGSGMLAGGASVFALFGLPLRPGPRQAYFLELLLPYLHLAMLRLPAERPQGSIQLAGRPLSAREREIAVWLREGKSNEDIAAILGISPSTVKNHLQRMYRILSVGNRTQAVARCAALQLLPPPQKSVQNLAL